MSAFRQWLHKLVAFSRRRRFEQEMAEEMRFHLQQRAADCVAEGMSPGDAQQAAQRKFGNGGLIAERARDEVRFMKIEQLLQDMRYAMRSLRKNPGFALAVVVTLALGLGANTALFSAVHAVLLRALPYADAEQIYRVEAIIPGQEQAGALPMRIQDYLEWREAQMGTAQVAALRPGDWVITGRDEPEWLGGARVSPNFFSFLGVPLARGRGFTAEEGVPGNDRVVVISEALWRRRFGAAPNLVGQSIELAGVKHTVIGIAPASLLMPTGSLFNPSLTFALRIDVWKPIAPTPAELQGESWNHGLLVRISAKDDVERVRQRLQAMLNRSIRQKAPDFTAEIGVRLTPLREVFSGNVRGRLLLVLGASMLLLAVACTNIANLLLARMASRATEFTTRVALGAGRARIVQQVLTETFILAALAGILGTTIGLGGARWLKLQGPEELRLLGSTQIDPAVLGYSLGAALVAALLCGLLPAWTLLRQGAGSGLHADSQMRFGRARGSRVRQALIGVEVALGTVLLVCAGLLLHSFVNASRIDRGYKVERELAVDLALSGSRYAKAESRVRFFADLVEAARALPGVDGAGLISDLPAGGSVATTQGIFLEADVDQRVVLQRPLAAIRAVTPGYFAASGSALRAGRWFGEHEEVPVALIGESLARRLWPQEPLPAIIGRAIRQGDVVGPLVTVVGIVEDVRPGSAEPELPLQLYRPHSQFAQGRMSLVLRTVQAPSSVAAALRHIIQTRDANLPISSVRTMDEIVSASLAARRFETTLTLLFAVVALALGAIGVYGVVSYAVACRTRDIGVRVALGASRQDVMRWVFRLGLVPVTSGLVVGLAAAVATAIGLRAALFGITPTDPASLVTVAVTLLAASTLACWLPARRAAQVDPIIALRTE